MFPESKGKGKREGLQEPSSIVPAKRSVIDLTVAEDEFTCQRLEARLQAQSSAPPHEKAKK